MIDNKTVGQAIAKLRNSQNMTQQTLAACLNVSHQAVSKWEKGAALPDVLTLVELSRMFGVTLEQLLAGDVDFRVQGHETKAEKPIELKLDYEDIRAKAERAAAEAERIAEEAKQACGEAEESADAAEDDGDEKDDEIDIDRIIEMAPFMSRAALDEIAMNYKGKCTPRQLAKLAPFLSKEGLERLVVNCESEISWDTLRRLAPFLRKEAVDAMAAAAAKGEKYTSEIGRHISKGVKKAVKIGEQIYNETIKPGIKKVLEKDEHKARPEPTGDERVSAARSRIFERAMNEERFDWIGEHIGQLDNEELKGRIAARALELGKTEWLEEYMEGFCDQDSLDNAILNGNWEYIAAHIENAGDDALALIADIAVSEDKWDWLCANIEFIGSHEDIAVMLAEKAIASEKYEWLDANMEFLSGNWSNENLVLAAYQSGHKALAEVIIEEKLSESDLNTILEAALVADDESFAESVIEHNGGDNGAVCINAARAGHLKTVTALAEHLKPETVAVLLDIAGEQGDWEAIDILNDLLG